MKENLQPFKGQDLVVTKKVIIPPREHSLVPILIRPDVIPSTNILEVSSLYSSTRSRLAQMHLELQSNAPQMIANQIAARRLEGRRLGYSFSAKVAVYNYADRVMQIDNQPIGRLYRPAPNPITGEELADLMADGSIRIEGKSWEKRYKTAYGKSVNDLVGATLKIDSSRRLGVPPSTKQPLQLIDVEGADYREKIDERLVPLPNTDDTVLWIGNTGVEIGMVEGIDGILHEGVYLSPKRREDDVRVGKHINALLLDGGKPAWLIRVEVWGKALRGLVENFIDVEFRRAAKNPPTLSRIPPNA